MYQKNIICITIKTVDLDVAYIVPFNLVHEDCIILKGKGKIASPPQNDAFKFLTTEDTLNTTNLRWRW